MRSHTSKQHGFLAVLVLIFGAVFFLMLVAFMGFVINQSQVQEMKKHEEQALAIAEAGLSYYKWYLAHNPNDLTNGTGEEGPYIKEYEDSEGDVVGEYSLSVSGTNLCGDITSIEIESTGIVDGEPDSTRTVYARYMRPTVAEYAYIINANVWAGPDRTIIGPYHSNGVIRMDGTNNSIVSSGQEDWECDGSIPCDPDDEGDIVDAVYGDGTGSDLWVFPQPPISFTGITVDLATMQDKAQNGGGLYIAPSGHYGYRVRFNSDGTVSLFDVDSTYNYYGYTTEGGWQYERHVIEDDDPVGTYDIPDDCAVLFVEDKVWLEGTVNGRVTIVAADLDSTGVNPSIILNDNITYANEDSGLLAVAENDVLLGLVVPDDMTVNGIFVAQNGRFGRNHYAANRLPSECVEWFWFWCVNYDTLFEEYIYRDTLTVNGTIVSNGRVGSKWSSGGTFISGFDTRYNSYDRDLVSNPPPLTPDTSDSYEFIEWREVE
ncbi:MAG: hypothetical protein WDZ93_02905 [Candidatus Paceibacterota bacterium]